MGHPVRDLLEKEQNYTRLLETMAAHFCDDRRFECLGSYAHSTLFGCVRRLAQLHRELLAALEAAERDPARVAAVLAACLADNKAFRDTYTQYCNQQHARSLVLREELERNTVFAELCDATHRRRVFGLMKLDQLVMAPVQRVTRYRLHLEDILRATPAEHAALLPLRGAYRAAAQLAALIDTVVDQQRSLELLLAMPSRVRGCPAQLASQSSGRFFVSKIGLTLAKQKHTLFLFSDCVLLAAKLGSRKAGRRAPEKTHEFRSLTDLAALKLYHSPKSRSLELSLLAAGGAPGAFHRFTVNSPAKGKAERLLADVETLRTWHAARASAAPVSLLAAAGAEIHFHAHASLAAYEGARAPRRIALLFLDGVAVPDALQPPPAVGALGVIQARGEAFRAVLKYRGLLVASEHAFTPTRDFHQAAAFAPGFAQAVANCGRLLATYPPFDAATQQQARLRLEALAAAHGSGLARLRSSLLGKLQRAARPDAADAYAQRLWDDSMSLMAGAVDDLRLSNDDIADALESAPRALEPAPPVFGGPAPRRKSAAPSAPAARASPLNPLYEAEEY